MEDLNMLNDSSIVLIGIAGMFILIISFLLAFNMSQRRKFEYKQRMQQLHEQQQNQLIEAAVRSEETERHRISEELHDEVGALLSATKLYLNSVPTTQLGETEKNLLSKTSELLNDSIAKVRAISHNLHSGILKELGLNEAIRSFLQKIGKGDSLQTSADLDDTYTAGAPENDISIYRIIQELCSNIMKHGKASRLSIQSVAKNNQLEITLYHDGTGLSQEEFERLRYQANGLGLKNIQNRIILLKGSIRFSSAPGDNRIVLQLPLMKMS